VRFDVARVLADLPSAHALVDRAKHRMAHRLTQDPTRPVNPRNGPAMPRALRENNVTIATAA
jgi:hypothetical protein